MLENGRQLGNLTIAPTPQVAEVQSLLYFIEYGLIACLFETIYLDFIYQFY